jgi:hypothetical protein
MGNPLYPAEYEKRCKDALKGISADARAWIGHHLNNSLGPVLGFVEGHCSKEMAKNALEHAMGDIRTILNGQEGDTNADTKQ